ncbi:MAG: hypothetical protein Q8N63_02965 [Nanoarchaeota archaeon]|nr:hypothetical protein [Nanoarchaeota archaeon]
MKNLIVWMLVVLMMMNGTVFAVESFKVLDSKYTSWSTIIAASYIRVGGVRLVDVEKNKMGVKEKEWGVDFEIVDISYPACVEQYAAGQGDFVCITNIDILPISLALESVALDLTSTSYGADGWVWAKKFQNIEQLKGIVTRGPERSVSEYAQNRILQILGKNKRDYPFSNMDPAEVLTGMLEKKIEVGFLWNPEKMNVLRGLEGSHVPYNSTMTPGEILDMIVASQKSLDRKDGDKAACALLDIIYTFNRYLADPKTNEKTLGYLGKASFDLPLQDMITLVKETRFYPTPEINLDLIEGKCTVFPWGKEVKDIPSLFSNKSYIPNSTAVTSKKLQDVMPLVVKYNLDFKYVDKEPSISYGPRNATNPSNLRFDTTYIKKVMAR